MLEPFAAAIERIVTLASMAALSPALTVTEPPDNTTPLPAARSIYALLSLRTRLLDNTAAAPNESAPKADESPTLLAITAFSAIASTAVTDTPPALRMSEPVTKAKVSSGSSFAPKSVPSRLLIAAVAMLPISQPTALKASEALSSAPLEAAAPATEAADTDVVFLAFTSTPP